MDKTQTRGCKEKTHTEKEAVQVRAESRCSGGWSEPCLPTLEMGVFILQVAHQGQKLVP